MQQALSVTVTGVSESTPNNPQWTGSTGTLSLYENQPAGTVVGEFNATDPDAGAVMISLGEWVRDGNNSSLLWRPTARSEAGHFRLQSNASVMPSVFKSGRHNATTEGNFTVLLLDVKRARRTTHPVD